MPVGIYKRSEAYREKMAERWRGAKNPNWKGGWVKKVCPICKRQYVVRYKYKHQITCSYECVNKRKKITQRGWIYGLPKGNIPWNKGKSLSKEHIANALKNRTYQRGDKHWNWKGGKTSEAERLRKQKEYKKWRKEVFERDDYTCWICEKRGGDLYAHHLMPFAFFPTLRLKVSNGLTLCKECHKLYTDYGEKAKIYGNGLGLLNR